MSLSKDNKGNDFIEVNNIRITYVRNENRSSEKAWSGSDVLRIQAKISGENDRLHRGAELPIDSPQSILQLMEGILSLYNQTVSN